MLRPRKLQLGTDAIPRHWFGGSAVASHIANGVNLLFPAGERYFVRSVNHYLDGLSDETLRAEVRGFFGQEGSHARAHEQAFERLRAQGYRIDDFLRVYQRFSFDFLERRSPPALNLAATAAAEHFTAIMAEGALENSMLDHAHPEMRRLLLWHAAEEIEHKHVAFDVLRAVDPSYALRMAGLAMATVNLMAWWLVATTMLLRQDGLSLGSARRELRAMRRYTPPDGSVLRRVFARGIREYVRRDFHPRQNDNYELARAYLEEAGLEPGEGSVMDYTDKHAIVGAGFSGLGVAAAFKRGGIGFDAFEADDDLGGNWYHGVYETVHIISSRKTTEYSDWPMPADWPDFPSAAQMLAYLRGYADHFQLRPHIAFRTRVTHVAPERHGRWAVTIVGPQGSSETRVYGGVVVANGHHWDRRWPEYPGEFTGERIHAKDYKTHAILAGKRVLVIGGGNSACDIAVEAARSARASHISMRRGYWFLPKTMLGVPTAELMKPWMPARLQRRIVKSLVRVIVGRYQDYGLAEPDHEPFERHPTINSELLHQLRHGRIAAHPDIRRWDGTTVEFVDGTREPIDLVVCATGYHVSFPFLAEGVVDYAHGMPRLIGGMMPPAHKNLYVFGVGQPRYGAGPLISAGADMLCSMVATQRQLEHPLGALMERLGARPPRTHLQDPFQILRQVRIGKKILPRLPALEAWVMGKRRDSTHA